MTRTMASFVAWLSLLAVTVAAGGYTVTYLFTWQWMRAQIAGLAFVAALIASSTLVVLARLRRLERRLDVLAAAASTPRPGDVLPDVEPRPDFRWLASPPSRSALLGLPLLGWLRPPEDTVFIPVLLATGLVVAGAASVVERLSALRHREPVPFAAAAPVLPDRRGRPFVLVPLVGAVVIAAVVAGLWRTAHYRSEPLGPGVTTLTVEVDRSTENVTEAPEVPQDEAVAVVGRYCAVSAGIDVRFVGVGPGPAGTTRLRVSPLLDAAAQERYTGCLRDAVLDRHSLSVVATDLDPQ